MSITLQLFIMRIMFHFTNTIWKNQYPILFLGWSMKRSFKIYRILKFQVTLKSSSLMIPVQSRIFSNVFHFCLIIFRQSLDSSWFQFQEVLSVTKFSFLLCQSWHHCVFTHWSSSIPWSLVGCISSSSLWQSFKYLWVILPIRHFCSS